LSIIYNHNMAIKFPLVPAALTVICILLLRGAQTQGEINNYSGRLFEFESLEEVHEIINTLSEGDNLYVRQNPKRLEHMEQRYTQLFGAMPEATETVYEKSASNVDINGFETRISKLEDEITYLRENLDKLLKELLG